MTANLVVWRTPVNHHQSPTALMVPQNATPERQIQSARLAVGSRPVFLNLLQLQMPVGALTSIGHRLSGILLAASTPVLVYLLGHSLEGERGFSEVAAFMDYLPAKGVTALVVWALAHHILAGIRHMLSDINVGSPLRFARRSAYAVNIGGAGFALFALWALLT